MPKDCSNCAAKQTVVPVDVFPSHISDHERTGSAAIVIEAGYCEACGVLHESYDAEPE
jgi:hypothetical protein